MQTEQGTDKRSLFAKGIGLAIAVFRPRSTEAVEKSEKRERCHNKARRDRNKIARASRRRNR